ncbi:MAG: hypothetical protein GY810_11875 [Aureispira sp.]|nr:hypothetical protein [Aureispira sp.]
MERILTQYACIFLFLISTISLGFGQESKWINHEFPHLGVQFQFPDIQPIETLDFEYLLEGYFNDDELEITIGLIYDDSKYYDLESWFEPFNTSGNFPLSFNDYPAIKNKAKDIVYFIDEDAYTMRCFIPVRNNYFFTIQINAWFEHKAIDIPIIKKVLEGIVLETSNSLVLNNDKEINARQKGVLKGKIKSEFLEFSHKDPLWEPVLKFDRQGRLWMIRSNKKMGTQLSRFDDNLKIVQNIALDNDKDYLDIAFDEHDIYVAYSYNIYKAKGMETPDRFWSKLGLIRYNLSGKELWDSEVMPEKFIKETDDRGAISAATLAVMSKEIIVYYPLNGKFDDGITHQGDAYKVLNKDGTINNNKGDGWHVSHSFGQRIGIGNDHAFLYALGDAHPRGINLHVLRDDNGLKSIRENNIFPFKGKIGDNYVSNTIMSNALVDDQYSYLILSTEEGILGRHSGRYDTENDLILLVSDYQGNKVLEKNITNTPDKDELLLSSINFMNGNILVHWYEYEFNGDKLKNLRGMFMIIDKKGNIITQATPLVSSAEKIFENWGEKGLDLSAEHDVDDFIYTAVFKNKVAVIRGLTFYLSNYVEVLLLNP